jgi:similar to stage IV sporulation protein
MIKNIFENVTRIKVTGLNLNRIFKRFRRKEIAIKDIKRTSHKEILFTVDSHKVKNVLSTLDDSCYNVSIEKRYGLSYFLQHLKQNVGFIIGIFLILLTVIVSNNFIWNIEIYGLDDITKQEILNSLSAEGARVGGVYSGKTVASLENNLQQSLDNISMVSILKKGSSLIVNIKEVRVPEVIKNLSSTASLVSDFDAIITAVNVVQGTALVEVGDVVKRGDTLIAGHFKNGNNATTNCLAIGEVFAKVWYSHTVNFETEKTQYIKTGKSTQQVSLGLFGSEFEVKNKINPYVNFVEELSTGYLFNNNIIPIKVIRTTYYQTTPITITQNFDDYEQELKNEALIWAKEKVPINIEPVKKFITVEKNDDIYSITAYIECHVKINIIDN